MVRSSFVLLVKLLQILDEVVYPLRIQELGTSVAVLFSIKPLENTPFE